MAFVSTLVHVTPGLRVIWTLMQNVLTICVLFLTHKNREVM